MAELLVMNRVSKYRFVDDGDTTKYNEHYEMSKLILYSPYILKR